MLVSYPIHTQLLPTSTAVLVLPLNVKSHNTQGSYIPTGSDDLPYITVCPEPALKYCSSSSHLNIFKKCSLSFAAYPIFAKQFGREPSSPLSGFVEHGKSGKLKNGPKYTQTWS